MTTITDNGRISQRAFDKLVRYIASGEMDCDYRCQKKGLYSNYTLLAILIATEDYKRALDLVNDGASFSVWFTASPHR